MSALVTPPAVTNNTVTNTENVRGFDLNLARSIAIQFILHPSSQVINEMS